MESIIAAPYMIKNCCSSIGRTLRENYVLIGRDNEKNLYSCKLFFSMAFLSDEIFIERATLRMFCNSRETCDAATLIYAKLAGMCQRFCTQTSIEGPGSYEWDLTEMMNKLQTYAQFEVCLFTHPTDYCQAKAFCAQTSSYPIILEIVIHKKKEINTYEYKEDYLSAMEWNYSKWIDCSIYKNYVFHIFNAGTTPIDVVLNISPDKNCFVESSPMYAVEPQRLIVLDPLKYSFYVRAAFKNTEGCDQNLVKIWFQAQR